MSAPIRTEEFLKAVPPGVQVLLSPADWIVGENRFVKGGHDVHLTPPSSLTLHCGVDICDGPKIYDLLAGSETQYFPPELQHRFWQYRCRHCQRSVKTFALRVDVEVGRILAFKLGEAPPFGAPLSARLLQVAGADAGILKKGRQCENHGLGIGAFAYYRRVVELQKVRLIDAIEAALRRLGADPAALERLSEARTENQFTKAVGLMASVVPKELFVGGQNPLTLLHKPLSVGLHGLSDEECLRYAHSIRVVLTAMLERMGALTEDSAELDAAIRDLTKSHSVDES